MANSCIYLLYKPNGDTYVSPELCGTFSTFAELKIHVLKNKDQYAMFAVRITMLDDTFISDGMAYIISNSAIKRDDRFPTIFIPSQINILVDVDLINHTQPNNKIVTIICSTDEDVIKEYACDICKTGCCVGNPIFIPENNIQGVDICKLCIQKALKTTKPYSIDPEIVYSLSDLEHNVYGKCMPAKIAIELLKIE